MLATNFVDKKVPNLMQILYLILYYIQWCQQIKGRYTTKWWCNI